MHNDELGESSPSAPTRTPRFLTVGAAARLLGMSEATLYRAIRADQFPALRIRSRYVVPGKALDAMEGAALGDGRLVDAAEWT